MPDRWFYKSSGKEYGPVNPSELRVLVDAQLISPSTPVRKVDDEGWVKASQISGLFEPSSETNPRERRRSRRSDSHSPTSKIKRRESAVVAEPSDPSPPTNEIKRQKSAVVAITEHQRQRIHKLLGEGLRVKEIAERIGVSTTTIIAVKSETGTQIEGTEPRIKPRPLPAPQSTAEPAIDEEEVAAEPLAAANVDGPQTPVVANSTAARQPRRVPSRRPRGQQNMLAILIAVGAVVFVALAGLVIYLVSQREVSLASKPSTQDDRDQKDLRPAIDADEFEDPNKPSSDTVQKLSPREFIKKYEKSVVRIQVITAKGAGVGSGFVADSNGTVVTNHHVIKDAKSGKAEFNSYHQFAGYEIAGVLYFDTAIDIAIIKLKTSKQLPHLDLARQPPEKGEPLMIFGAPDGAPFVANPGSVTAVNMASDLPDKYGTHWKGYWIRTDAKVWHGNSGGPMMSLDSHRVVGVVTWGDPKVPGANFASASQNIKAALDGAKNARVVPLGSAELSGRSKWPK
ncbi:MAG: trypsin-like peptidase domain-containing protein [Pirellulales bacterium]